MAQRRADARHSLAEPTGDPLLDLLACAMRAAFKEAAESGPSAHEAREFITQTLSPDSLTQLRSLQLINW